MSDPDYDVLIVGAGISGIGAGCAFRKQSPQTRFAIFEARNEIGGTWSLFQYPGIRSDSDMYTFGYRFRPWDGERSISDGASIIRYLRDTVSEYDLGENIRFRHKVLSVDFDSAERVWRIQYVVQTLADTHPVHSSTSPAVPTAGSPAVITSTGAPSSSTEAVSGGDGGAKTSASASPASSGTTESPAVVVAQDVLTPVSSPVTVSCAAGMPAANTRSSSAADTSTTSDVRTVTARFLYACTGYYRYSSGYTPDIPGLSSFRGAVVHPQHWPRDLDCSGKRVCVVGSGATAVTLIPSLVNPDDPKRAAHVTMLQRSPTFIAALPSKDCVADVLRRWLPSKVAHSLVRWKNIAFSVLHYGIARAFPRVVRGALMKEARRRLPPGFDMSHFSPRYAPWDQRICVAPDGDFFAAIRRGDADVVTDRIRTVTADGVETESGTKIPCDVLVTATGLVVELFGGAQVSIDQAPVDVTRCFVYKGFMMSNVPNFAFAVGYTNASWTLRVDLTNDYLCRLLNAMRRHRLTYVMPRPTSDLQPQQLLGLTSGYVKRGENAMPRQGDRLPWRLYQNYVLDLFLMRYTPLHDAHLVVK
eukprot:TRINITY_DN45951_c0_g1_i1.p1 TRINITY_DN45951_c0_g1~~TRINITY_DN45951_c0_g1_i1.p1  ORF type:complete len:587 (+),score=123.98 TRINITY_DN45951_c0_g1_i1:198-1958(+)